MAGSSMGRRVLAALPVMVALLAASLRAEEPEPLLGGGVLDLIDKGGLVMVVILVGSVAGLALAFERLVSLRRRLLCPEPLVQAVRSAVEKQDPAALQESLEDARGPLARILAAGVQRRRAGAREMEMAMEAVGSHEVARLKRPVRSLAVLASVTPLLGLLGTILGMISTFNLLAGTSPADRVETLAPGIGQALYTTAAGLCVSIPFVLLYHWLGGRVNRAAEQWSLLGTDLAAAVSQGDAGGRP